jgi:hypothetical protein
MKCRNIPVITETTGIVKVLKKILEAIPGKHSTDSLLIGPSYTIRKVQQSET